MYCMECGTEIVGNAKFCGGCGYNVIDTPHTENTNTSKRLNKSDEIDFNSTLVLNERFIKSSQFDLMLGNKSDYYRKPFLRLEAILNGYKSKSYFEKVKLNFKAISIGFNWAAAFLGVIWFGYRRMYVNAIMFAALEAYWYHKSKTGWGEFGSFVGMFIACGSMGNRTYFDHINKKLAKCKNEADIVVIGNTSIIAVLIYIFASIVGGLILNEIR